jgi:two-component system chemotaxis response regulator CheB
MSRKIRVLVVDDAVVVRRLLSEVIDGDPELEVVGVAANGKVALAKVAQLQPDLVTLDVEMPELDGLAALRQLRRIKPKLPVIMFSTTTRRGAAATVEALTLGANDYVTKPDHTGNFTAAMAHIRDELVPRIKALCARPESGGLRTLAPTPLRPTVAGVLRPVRVIAIGCSTGGPNALASLLPRLPKDLPVPIVIVQHMPKLFTRLLAERLDQICAIDVEEGALGVELRAGAAFVAPGDFHMRVQGGARPRLSLDQTEPRNSCRPAVDVLFESVATAYGDGVLGVVLTGMGQDGLRGAELIREAGGDLLAQDQASSVVWGMPGFVARRGLASEVLPLDALGDAIVRRVRASLAVTRPARELVR